MSTDLLSRLPTWSKFLIAVLSGLFYLVFRTALPLAGVGWAAAAIFALLGWYDLVERVSTPPMPPFIVSIKTSGLGVVLTRIGVLLLLFLVLGIFAVWGWFLWEAA